MQSFKFWKFVELALVKIVTEVRFTPSADEAVSAYEPIRTPLVPLEYVCVPTAVFLATVNEFAASESELAATPALDASWLEV